MAPQQGKKFKRKLTLFLCREMLYDYAIDRLDQERHAAVEEFLRGSPECQETLKAIRTSIAYAKSISGTQLSTESLAQIRSAENALSLGRRYSSLREWPSSVKWFLKAMVLAGMIGAAAAFVPWKKIPLPKWDKKPSEVLELAEIPGQSASDQLRAANDRLEGQPEMNDQGSGDDMLYGTATDEGEAVGSKASSQKPSKTSANSGSAMESESDVNPKGMVYRISMAVKAAEEVAPIVVEDIISLGGEKAGEVDLGWKRGAGHYFHFAIPAENEKKLLERLRVHGPVRLSSQPDPRVMPRGQLRFILWVENAN